VAATATAPAAFFGEPNLNCDFAYGWTAVIASAECFLGAALGMVVG